jgi:hypothetical protein
MNNFQSILSSMRPSNFLPEAVGVTTTENIVYLKDTLSKLKKLRRKKHDEDTTKEINTSITSLESLISKLK